MEKKISLEGTLVAYIVTDGNDYYQLTEFKRETNEKNFDSNRNELINGIMRYLDHHKFVKTVNAVINVNTIKRFYVELI